MTTQAMPYTPEQHQRLLNECMEAEAEARMWLRQNNLRREGNPDTIRRGDTIKVLNGKWAGCTGVVLSRRRCSFESKGDKVHLILRGSNADVLVEARVYDAITKLQVVSTPWAPYGVQAAYTEGGIIPPPDPALSTLRRHEYRTPDGVPCNREQAASTRGYAFIISPQGGVMHATRDGAITDRHALCGANPPAMGWYVPAGVNSGAYCQQCHDVATTAPKPRTLAELDSARWVRCPTCGGDARVGRLVTLEGQQVCGDCARAWVRRLNYYSRAIADANSIATNTQESQHVVWVHDADNWVQGWLHIVRDLAVHRLPWSRYPIISTVVPANRYDATAAACGVQPDVELADLAREAEYLSGEYGADQAQAIIESQPVGPVRIPLDDGWRCRVCQHHALPRDRQGSLCIPCHQEELDRFLNDEEWHCAQCGRFALAAHRHGDTCLPCLGPKWRPEVLQMSIVSSTEPGSLRRRPFTSR